MALRCLLALAIDCNAAVSFRLITVHPDSASINNYPLDTSIIEISSNCVVVVNRQ